jgi:hypothetical protein
MPFQPPCPSSVLISVLAAAGVVLAVAGCSHVTPLGPTPPQPRHLGSPIVLQATRSLGPTPTSGCPAGSVALSPPGDGSGCYHKLGPPVTLTSATVSPIISGPTTAPAGQQGGGQASYGFVVAVPAGDVAAVTAIIKQAYDSHGAVDISVAGKTWAAPQALKPFPGQQLQIFLPSRNQALQLRRMLIPPG